MHKDIVYRINFILEKTGWDAKPRGWNLKSMKKFARTLTGRDATEHGWFDACVTKLGKHFGEPEKICASLRDSILKTTYWRGKGKDIKKVVEEDVTEAKKVYPADMFIEMAGEFFAEYPDYVYTNPKKFMKDLEHYDYKSMVVLFNLANVKTPAEFIKAYGEPMNLFLNINKQKKITQRVKHNEF